MATGAIQRITVHEPEQMQMRITQFVAQGFVVANQSNRSVTLIKRKQFSIPLLVIGLLLCVIPLFIYLIVYSLQKDQIIEIVLIEAPKVEAYRASEHLPAGPNAAPAAAAVIQMSPDNQSWWDGSQWQQTATSYPPNAARKPDGSAWWDGQSWRPMPETGPGLGI